MSRVKLENIAANDGILVASFLQRAYPVFVAAGQKTAFPVFEERAVTMFPDVFTKKRGAMEFLLNYLFALKTGDADSLTFRRGLKVDSMVDVVQFAEAKHYLGMKGSIRPKVLYELHEIFHGEHSHDYIEVVLGGSIGWGKSFLTEIALGYMVYRLSCFRNPQLEFGLAPGSSMVFVVQSVTETQAKRVIFEGLGSQIRNSKYFKENFPFDKRIESEMRFPGNISIFPVSSNDTAALGLNVFGGAIDEVNFMSKIENSAKAKHSASGAYDQAQKLYTTTIRRMKSRFNDAGKIPGLLFLISSANYPGDFIDKKRMEYKELLDAGKTPYLRYAGYTAWGTREEYDGFTDGFHIEVGDSTRQSRILSSALDAIEPDDVYFVPKDFEPDFEQDIEAAIRDLVGVPVGSANAFIRERGKIELAAATHVAMYSGRQLFTKESIDLNLFEQDVGVLIDNEYLAGRPDVSEKYSIHVDLGLSQDSCGIAVSHLGGYKLIGHASNWDEESGRYIRTDPAPQPIIIVDGVIEIYAPQGG